eukprot:TRINITY_DN2685_c0_g3_i1.p1 TRINITY_DN2685_c0_g3~~TRINITY_DN2685_c0_g3_i1.p1  ORF type:complete len:1581 (+),score=418.17 TRINITY_DN2685_c0_g3_i1:533-4744(+)
MNALVNNDVPPSIGDDVDDGHNLHDERARLVLEKREDGQDDFGTGTPIQVGEEDSSLWNKMWFWWFTPLVKKGFYTALVHDDLPPVRSDDKAEIHVNLFDQKWEEETYKPEPKLLNALISANWQRFAIAAIFKVGNDVFIFTGPILLEQIVNFVNDPEQSVWVGVALAFGILIGSTIQSLSMQQYWQLVFRIAMNVNTALISKVYSKALVLSHRERQTYTVGEIMNLQAVDAKQLSTIITMLHQVWSAPVQIIVSIALLWRILGVASLGGLAVMIGTSPLQVIFGKILATMTKDIMMKKDKRIKLTNEILQGIRVIKFFAWEDSYHKALSDVRKEELVVLRTSAFTRSGIMVLWSVTPLLVTILSFGIFVALKNELNAAVAFSSLALFNVMRFPLNIFPMLIAQMIEAQISLGRLEKFFKGEELDPNARQVDPYVKAQVAIEGGDFEWAVGETVLKGINLEVPKGSLVALVGEVGAGKSSLLSAMLGEMPKIRGRVVVNGTLAYVPQSAWMKNDTLKGNILFGKEDNRDWYQQVIKNCQLEPDFAILPGNDKTEIGEKGINLSGGQKQRVSVARAIYSDADIYLLDDPLSAVDAHVGKALFNKCIKGLLRDKTRILATHQLQFLKQCDKIVVMSQGRITNVGSYEELMANSKEFNDLLSKHVVDTEDSEEEVQEHLMSMTSPSLTKSSPGSEKKEEKPTGKLIVNETKSSGGVSFEVYKEYGRATGSLAFAVIILAIHLATQGSQMVSDYWLSAWSANSTIVNETMTIQSLTPMAASVLHSVTKVIRPDSDVMFTNAGRQTLEFGFPTCCYDDLGLGVPFFYLMVYGVIGLISTVLILIKAFALAQAGINASQQIHDDMLERVLHVPTSYFDTVPLGRIVNRFSSDQNTIDIALPRTLGMAIDTILVAISVLFVIASATPVFLIALISLSFLYRYAQSYYLRSSREIQRLASLARSPIFALFSESLTGLSTIRAYDKSSSLIKENMSRIERYNQADYMAFTSNRWLGAHLEFLGSCIVFAASFFAVISRATIDPGVAGLSISYALRLTSNLNWLVRMSTDVENNLISVERCLQFTKLEQEAAYDKSYHPPANWPSKGAISFKNLSFRYREGLPLVLNGISADIKPSEKIGVVGRTGAGKSSLMLALFRIVEPSGGSVIIDGEDISNLGLRDLRSSVAIIPQEATLFSGTIRSNLSPFGLHNDNQLWDVLEQVGMKEQVQQMSGRLDEVVSEFGENISVGSRQLLCLARAILRKNKILVMDEATANVDFETDAFIQKTIRRTFKDVTVLTIAHRINTILDSDRVIVLDKGQIIEFDNPQRLLSNPNSVFYSLAKEGGVLTDDSVFVPKSGDGVGSGSSAVSMPPTYSLTSKVTPKKGKKAKVSSSSSSSSSSSAESLVSLEDSS